MFKKSLIWLCLLNLVVIPTVFAQEDNEEFWHAAKQNDVAAVKALLKMGVDVNAKTRYGATALTYAADRGYIDVVNVLLENGADPNIKDSFYQATPLQWVALKGHMDIIKSMIEHGADLSAPTPILWASAGGHIEVVKFMLEKGSAGAQQVMMSAVREENLEMLSAVLETAKLDETTLSTVLASAMSTENDELIKRLHEAGAKMPEKTQSDEKDLAAYEGSYSSEGVELKIEVKNGQLVGVSAGQAPYNLSSIGKDVFEITQAPGMTLSFTVQNGKATGFNFKQGENITEFARSEKAAVAKTAEDTNLQPEKFEETIGKVETPKNWASFRGAQASGNGDGQFPPTIWDAEKSINISWKTAIPGLAHSCPIVWEDKVFITTAISSDTASNYKVGLYGDVAPVVDNTKHTWRIYALNKNTGELLWDRIAYESVPRVQRHPKSTHANSTPVTNGKYVVALFGSEGLSCYDFDGNLVWKKDLGKLDGSWFYDDGVQWGHASSPILYKNTIIVQCDRAKDSYIAAYDIATGNEVWKTDRDEIPSWGTPTVYFGKEHNELITNSSNHIYGYDPDTGKELWRLGPNSEVTVGSPVVLDGLIFVTAGYSPVRPIYAIKPGGRGDISIPDSLDSGEFIQWRTKRGGTYMPTPLAYDGLLYTLSNSGILNCYDAKTGEKKYRERVAGRGGYAFTASPVAADGKIYFTSEEGEVFVVKAGPTFELIAKNVVGEVCMATPAISDGMIFVRGQHHVFGIGHPQISEKD